MTRKRIRRGAAWLIPVVVVGLVFLLADLADVCGERPGSPECKRQQAEERRRDAEREQREQAEARQEAADAEADSGIDPDDNGTSYREDDMALTLAVIDNGLAGLTDYDVGPYASALRDLESTCVENRTELGDLAAATMRALKDRGADKSVRDVLEGTREWVSIASVSGGTSEPVSCNQAAAMWATEVMNTGA